VSKLIESVIRRVALAPIENPVVAFPFTRFLIYKEVGTTLAPHVDLCRVIDNLSLE